MISLAPNTIDVEIAQKEQLLSAYSYSKDRLNPELSDFLVERAHQVPERRQPLTIVFHTQDKSVTQDNCALCLRNHFRNAYIARKKDLQRTGLTALFMAILGIVFITVLFFCEKYWNNFFLTTILEVCSWVFIWEMVFLLFLRCPIIARDRNILFRLYRAKILVNCKTKR